MYPKVRRKIWGYAPNEHFDNDNLVFEKYQGIRPAPGYSACPEHTEKNLLWELLEVKENTGIWLTEAMAMVTTAAVSGFYFPHPEAVYFAVGRVNQEQVEDYPQRKGMMRKDAEYWPAPKLGYRQLARKRRGNNNGYRVE